MTSQMLPCGEGLTLGYYTEVKYVVNDGVGFWATVHEKLKAHINPNGKIPPKWGEKEKKEWILTNTLDIIVGIYNR